MSTFGEGILSDLAEADAFLRWRTDAAPLDRPLSQPAADDNRLLELMRGEIVQVAPVTCLVASLANAIESGLFPHIQASALKLFSPSYSVAFATAVERLSVDADMRLLIQSWQSLSAAMSLAGKLSETVAAPVAGRPGGVLCHVDIVADAWRRVCRATEALHTEITTELGSASAPSSDDPGPASLRMLRLAGHGGWPCLDRDGQISIPGAAERRSEPRRVIDTPVEIVIGDIGHLATLHNATSTGLGLEASLSVDAGAEIDIVVPDGRTLTGVVRWANDGKIGVRLLEPLLPEDALFEPH